MQKKEDRQKTKLNKKKQSHLRGPGGLLGAIVVGPHGRGGG